MSKHSEQRGTTNSRQGGFSLVELIVAVGIFITLSTTFLFNYNSFDRRITIDILAHQIATWIHQAQVSAMSIKRALNDATMFPGYGLHFSTATLVDNGKFVFFADLLPATPNRVYDALSGAQKCGDAGVECEQEVLLLQGNTVALLCGDAPSSAAEIASGPNCTSAVTGFTTLYTTNNLDAVFTRPNPYDATLYGDANASVPTPYGHVEITVASPKGYKHTITVWTTGQVSVK